MPLTNVQRKTAVTTVQVTSFSVVFTAGPTQGNLLVCDVSCDSTVTMSSSGWTLAASSVVNVGLYQWYKLAGASETSTVTVTPGGLASCEIAVSEWSGNVSSSPLDKSASGSAASASIPSGTTAATTQADEYALAAFGWGAGSTPTADTYTNSFIEQHELTGTGGTSTKLAVAEKTLVATGTQTTTVTMSAVVFGTASGLIATYKAAAGGGTVVKPLAALGVG